MIEVTERVILIIIINLVPITLIISLSNAGMQETKTLIEIYLLWTIEQHSILMMFVL